MFDRTPFLASTFPQPPPKNQKNRAEARGARARAQGCAEDRGVQPPLPRLREENLCGRGSREPPVPRAARSERRGAARSGATATPAAAAAAAAAAFFLIAFSFSFLFSLFFFRPVPSRFDAQYAQL